MIANFASNMFGKFFDEESWEKLKSATSASKAGIICSVFTDLIQVFVHFTLYFGILGLAAFSISCFFFKRKISSSKTCANCIVFSLYLFVFCSIIGLLQLFTTGKLEGGGITQTVSIINSKLNNLQSGQEELKDGQGEISEHLQSVREDVKSVLIILDAQSTPVPALPNKVGTVQVTDCDHFGANPSDEQRYSGVEGSYFSQMNIETAIQACEEAIEDFGAIPRFQYQLARAMQNAWDKDILNINIEDARKLFKSAFEGGHFHSAINLGSIYLERKKKTKICETGLQCSKIAIYWYNQAINNNLANGYTNLGDLYRDTPVEFIPKDKCWKRAKGADCDALAMEYYISAADAGDLDGIAKQAYMYGSGRVEGCNVDLEACDVKAVALDKKAHEQGVIWATANLGNAYYRFRGVSDCENKEECQKIGIEYLKEASVKGNVYAKMRLGDVFRDHPKLIGCNSDTCDAEAMQYYLEAEEAGEDEAIASKAYMYDKGRVEGCNKNQDACYIKAVELNTKAHEKGIAWATANLGNLYFHKRGVSDCEHLVSCQKKGIEYLTEASDKGNAFAKRRLGDIYRENHELMGCKPISCYSEAMKYYKEAEAERDNQAIASKAYMYDKGHVEGCYNSQDMCDEKAVSLYKEAHEKGVILATANLGHLYYFNRGVTDCQAPEECQRKGIGYLKEASDKGNAFAKMRLGDVFRDHPKLIGCNSDTCDAEAMKYYVEAEIAGDNQAIASRALMYDKGRVEGCDKNQDACYIKAVELNTKAHEKGIVWATANLGNLYFHKRGVSDCKAPEECQKKGIEYLTEASDKGNAFAKRRLGDIYRDDQEVLDCEPESCNEEALKYYQASEKAGDNEAIAKQAYLFELGIVEECANNQKACDVKALTLYKKAHGKGVVWATRNLGRLYIDLSNFSVSEKNIDECVDVVKCRKKGVILLTEAYKMGDTLAASWLAENYYYKLADSEKAKYWAIKSIKSKNNKSLLSLIDSMSILTYSNMDSLENKQLPYQLLHTLAAEFVIGDQKQFLKYINPQAFSTVTQRQVQLILVKLGYQITPDGEIGDQTLESIKHYGEEIYDCENQVSCIREQFIQFLDE